MKCENKIEVKHVSKVYKMYKTPTDRMKEGLSFTKKQYHTDFYALSDVSFDVEKGEILGIMGKNGAGKSTLLKIITGILKPSAGEVKVDGRISSLLELGAGFNMEYTGIENIYFYGMLMKLSKAQIDEKLKDIIEFAEIGDYVYQPVKTYSSGMFARLAFSCAINVEPDILIVDEILSVGDMRFQAKCFNKFKEFKQRGTTILYVGHDVGLMKKFCDTAIWLNHGQIVMTGDPAYVAAQYTEFMYVESEKEPELNFEDGNKEELERKKQEVITHWGTKVGTITNIKLSDTEGNEKMSYEPNDRIKIHVEFKDDKEFEYDKFSVAFSIKNKEGMDLIVKSTYEENIVFERNDLISVDFTFEPHLASGEYYVVIALEDRKNASILYYEYIEGAAFFKIYTEKATYGLFEVDADIDWR